MISPKTLLLMAHPGHELRVFQWYREVRPEVWILTDGSGGGATSRVHHSQRIAADVGAATGELMGTYTDRAVYSEILAGNFDFFIDQAERVLRRLQDSEFDQIAGDAAEGYNTSHDLCRAIIDSAVYKYQKDTGRMILNLAFPLTKSPIQAPDGLKRVGIQVDLTEEAFAEKIKQAHKYSDLATEVEYAVRVSGLESFKSERLWHQEPWLGFDVPIMNPPNYEIHAAMQVAAGRYATVIRFETHLKPILQRLRQWAQA